MQNVFRGDGFAANAAFGKRHILGDTRVQMMAHHQHIEMFVDRVDRKRPGGIGRRRQNIGLAAEFYNVRCMAAASAFGVEGVNGAALEGSDGILDKAGFVQRVRVDRHLHV